MGVGRGERPKWIKCMKRLGVGTHKLGISLMSWSCDGTILATVNENMPHAVWVWEVEQAELSTVLLHISPVKAVEWAPQGHSLAICTGSPRVYLWSPGGASVVHVPLPGFKVAWAQGQIPLC